MFSRWLRNLRKHFEKIELKKIIFGALGDYRIKLLPSNITDDTTFTWLISYFLIYKDNPEMLNSFLRNYVKLEATIRLKSLLNDEKGKIEKKETAIAILKDAKERSTFTLNMFKKIDELSYSIPELKRTFDLSSSSENISLLYKNISRKRIWKQVITWFGKEYLNDWQKDIESSRKKITALEKEIKWWQNFYKLSEEKVAILRKHILPRAKKLQLSAFTADLKNKIEELQYLLELISAEKYKRIDIAEMRFEPSNEEEVLCLTALLAAKGDLPLRIRKISKEFPDIIADYYTPKGWKRSQRIEIEYKSENFVKHKHNPNDCDMIICWMHNWSEHPKNLQIIELRNFVKRRN